MEMAGNRSTSTTSVPPLAVLAVRIASITWIIVSYGMLGSGRTDADAVSGNFCLTCSIKAFNEAVSAAPSAVLGMREIRPPILSPTSMASWRTTTSSLRSLAFRPS